MKFQLVRGQRSRIRLPPCGRRFRSYNLPVLDIKLIRNELDFARQRFAIHWTGDDARVDERLKLDKQRWRILAEVENLKIQRNRPSKEINALMGQKKTTKDWCPAKRYNESRRAQLFPEYNARIK